MARPYYFRAFTALTAMTTAALAALLVAYTPAEAQSTTVYIVNSTADDDDGACVQPAPFNPSGDCTLREAINAANATAGAVIINFGILGPGVKTIHVGAPCSDHCLISPRR